MSATGITITSSIPIAGATTTTATSNTTTATSQMSMDFIEPVEKDLDRVLAKFANLRDHVTSTLQEQISQIEQLHQDLMAIEASPNSNRHLSNIQRDVLNESVEKILKVAQRIGLEHRELHGSVSKVGKSIDKNFAQDFVTAFENVTVDAAENRKILDEVVVEHFLRHGMMDIAEELVRESHLPLDDTKKKPFAEINEILESLNRKDVRPALAWVDRNRAALREQDSCLEFRLHRLAFIELLNQGLSRQAEIVEYAREHLQPLARRHERDIQTLMGSLLYLKVGLVTSPYNHLLDPMNWTEICDLFTRDACTLLGFSVESPLTTTIHAGTVALPALLHMKQTLARQVNGIWSNRDELPVEVDLGPRYQFHSTFACPILRHQSTAGNPPMRLVCGHVISKDALQKLSNGTKLKCPYCPMEMSPGDCRQIYF